MASLQRSLQIKTSSSNFDKNKVRTSQILETIADLQHDMFALRSGEALLFHGTIQKNVPKILRKGFKTAKNTRSP